MTRNTHAFSAATGLVDMRLSVGVGSRPWLREATQPAVLLVGLVPSLTWKVARSLALAGMRPTVLSGQRLSPMQLMPGYRYVHWRNVRYVNGELDAGLVEQIEQTCRTHAIDKVVAADFPTSLLLTRHGRAVKSARIVPLPDADLMHTLHNKWLFSGIVARLGLPQPRTELAVDAATLLATRLTFPIITKPVDRWDSVGVQKHRTREELERCLASGGLKAEFPLLVQEFIPGRDVGFAFVAKHGRLIASAAFEQPERGQRRHFDAPRLRHQVALLVRETGYHGVGEIDLRYNPSSDEYRFLEVNPRFWASVLHATRAGMNFPELLVRLDSQTREIVFQGRRDAVQLSPYELGVSRGVLLTEKASNAVLRRLERT